MLLRAKKVDHIQEGSFVCFLQRYARGEGHVGVRGLDLGPWDRPTLPNFNS